MCADQNPTGRVTCVTAHRTRRPYHAATWLRCCRLLGYSRIGWILDRTIRTTQPERSISTGPVMNKSFLQLTSGALGVCAGLAIAAAPAAAQSSSRRAPVVYVAKLAAMNTGVTKTAAAGTARFTIVGDSLTIAIDVHGVAPGLMHLQHFHGFPGAGNATCPTSAADVNHDGVVDLIETEPTSGTTMVPFTADPVSMVIVTDSYPTASADGSYKYEKTVSLKALDAAFSKQYKNQKLDLARRVVFIHGIPATTTLPATVKSLGTIPAQVTIPIACGKIKRVAK